MVRKSQEQRISIGGRRRSGLPLGRQEQTGRQEDLEGRSVGPGSNEADGSGTGRAKVACDTDDKLGVSVGNQGLSHCGDEGKEEQV